VKENMGFVVRLIDFAQRKSGWMALTTAWLIALVELQR
jgi:hypothetical protein